jgi:hypothetical protein
VARTNKPHRATRNRAARRNEKPRRLLVVRAQNPARRWVHVMGPLAGETSDGLIILGIVRKIFFAYKSLDSVSRVRTAEKKSRHVVSLSPPRLSRFRSDRSILKIELPPAFARLALSRCPITVLAVVQVAARIEAHPAAVDIRAGARNTAVVDNLRSICGPTGRDVFPVDNPRKRPTSER